MRSSFTVSVLNALVIVLAFPGCAAEADKPAAVDPTSAEALRRAEPLSTVCTYVEETRSSYGTASDVTVQHKCTPGDCARVTGRAATAMSDGYGGMYSSSTSYLEMEDKLGTCEDPKPITCEGRTGADACEACLLEFSCSSLVRCEADPNCFAVAECFEHCGADEACQERCTTNGEPTAVASFRSLVNAVQYACGEACE